ncbi:unnamed protein product [Cylicocyclus nassatus]|uniref:Uncharacterized protein n=1 Tax=Cylicocyclus nassatus TaxID=53992 RepID=A0AA36M922_CYLNA|nr:unnamed protein product [Cylicocyclus nassatus]
MQSSDKSCFLRSVVSEVAGSCDGYWRVRGLQHFKVIIFTDNRYLVTYQLLAHIFLMLSFCFAFFLMQTCCFECYVLYFMSLLCD